MMPLSPRPHDLLRVTAESEYFYFERDADAAFNYVQRDALVVVRRVASVDGRIAVGIRGDTRSERYAAWVAPEAITEVLFPTDLLHFSTDHVCAAFETLGMLKMRWHELAHPWGPTGGVGFELASSRPVVTATSDLDILITMQNPMTREDAARLLQGARALPCEVDVQVETLTGAFALREFAAGNEAVMLRTAYGPMLATDPWRLREPI